MALISLGYALIVLLLTLIPNVFSRPSNAERACATLSESLPQKVFFKGSNQFVESVSSYFYVQVRLIPACIVIPQSTKDVVSALEVFRRASIPFAIRGGGHASQKGAANVEGGVTVDMRAMNAVALHQDKELVSVGAGATWDLVYSKLDEQGLGVLGGRAAHVGLGGFLTGGGISFFSPQRGFACDYISNIELVLASGKLTTVNATHNKDLFTALKGGSNNFGIVTRFELKIFPQSTFWGGGVVYPESTFDQQIATFTRYKDPERFDPYAAAELSFVYIGASKMFLGASAPFYTKPIVNASALAGFTSIQPQISNTMRLSNTSDFTREVLQLSTPNQYSIWATTTFAITPTIIARIHKTWKASAFSMNKITNVTSSFTMQSIPPPPSPSNPNSLGFTADESPEKDLVLGLISVFYEDTSSQRQLDKQVKEFIWAIVRLAEDEGVSKRFTYLNYAAEWQDPLRNYGVRALAQLRGVARKYDPTGVFQKQVGGYKLFK